VSENAAYIAGDWGTSRLRLFLCDAAGEVLARAEGPGAAAGDCARVFAELTAAWDAKLPAILCGMVGSTIGWREVPYLDCPAPLDSLAAGALRFQVDGRTIVLLPGLKCRNKSGNPDVMRGEETQLAGAAPARSALARGRHLFCLPGTHAKWVEVEDGMVTQFQTALSGELFDLLARHSVLARDGGEARAGDPAFALGLAEARDHRKAGLLHLLFGTRSRQLAGEIGRDQASSYLSGLIIGEDVAGAAALFDFRGAVTLICTPALAALYGLALADYGVAVMNGEVAARAGLHSAWGSLFA
jgi:2-dehydro-3-deoxygalactonokinase